RSLSLSAIVRASTSSELPAGADTTNLSGRSGQLCAMDGAAMTSATSNAASLANASRNKDCSSFIAVCDAPLRRCVDRYPARNRWTLAIDAPANEILQQRLLRMHAIFRLVPHNALRPIDDLGGNFFAAMRGQAMHEQCVRPRLRHHFGVDHPVG